MGRDVVGLKVSIDDPIVRGVALARGLGAFAFRINDCFAFGNSEGQVVRSVLEVYSVNI